MSEEKEKPPEDCKVQMKTLFGKLTEMVVGSAKTAKDISDHMVMVSNWASLVLATLIVSAEGNKQDRAFVVVDRITKAINSEIKRHIVMIRGVLNKSKGVEESRIIVPEHLKED